MRLGEGFSGCKDQPGGLYLPLYKQGWRGKERKLCEDKREEEETKEENQNMTASERVRVLLLYGGV